MLNAAGIFLALIAWQAAGARLGDALLATPLQVALALSVSLRTAAFWQALGGMVGQMMIGYLAALGVGIPLGIAMGRITSVRTIVKPWAAMFVVVSAAALVPLFVILMGRGLLLCTAIVFAATVWYVVLTITEAARAVPANLLNVARSFDAAPLQRFRWVLLPALHPYILVAARIAFTHALRATITAQMFISSGYGGLLNDAGLDLSTASIFGLIVVMMVLSVAATGLMRRFAEASAPWHTSKASQR
jgi:ABC-type nitrate/sulfonate/bicarbonate transport system permease component